MVRVITQFKHYQATVHLRRGTGWDVKPEAEQMDGQKLIFKPGWIMDADDTSIYIGEWAMLPVRFDDWPDDAPGWIASGDLEDMKEVK